MQSFDVYRYEITILALPALPMRAELVDIARRAPMSAVFVSVDDVFCPRGSERSSKNMEVI